MEERGKGLSRTGPVVLIFAVLVVILLIVGFPRKKPLRDIVPPITSFEWFFKRNAMYFTHSLKDRGDGAGPLYKTFCTDPYRAGIDLERILNAAWNQVSYSAPLAKVFARDSGAMQSNQIGQEWTHDTTTACTGLASPLPIRYGGVRSREIRDRSAENYQAFSQDLQYYLAKLLTHATPSANRFKELRRSVHLYEELHRAVQPAPDGTAGGLSEKRLAPLLEAAGGVAGREEFDQVWLSLIYYCEGVDSVLRGAKDSVLFDHLEPIPGDDWFPKGILYAAQTPHGVVLVGGKGDNIYPAGDAFLIIDLGGDDTYFFDEYLAGSGDGAPPAPSCSTVLDFEGDDYYAGDVGTVAAGVLGFSTILDLDGNDMYRTDGLGLGAGFLGLGLVVDAYGNDEYYLGSFGLGAAAYGLGVLIDGGGDDRYMGYGLCQGFAGPGGIGLIVEEAGDDFYYANPSTPYQDLDGKEEREGAALAQGCTASFSDGSPAGLGVLLDLSGDDTYRCASLCQGAARGEGVALLLDARGYDFYTALDHGQGYGTEGGIGVVRDLQGNDHYLGRNYTQGMGDPGSLGFLIDDKGNDHYSALSGSQGKNRSDGTGMILDRSGKDRFFSRGVMSHPPDSNPSIAAPR